MTTPLGRAVIGGLVVSTFATLFIVLAMFALVMGDSKKVSPSIDPDDPSSQYYDTGRTCFGGDAWRTSAGRTSNPIPPEYCNAVLALDRTNTRSLAAYVFGPCDRWCIGASGPCRAGNGLP